MCFRDNIVSGKVTNCTAKAGIRDELRELHNNRSVVDYAVRVTFRETFYLVKLSLKRCVGDASTLKFGNSSKLFGAHNLREEGSVTKHKFAYKIHFV